MKILSRRTVTAPFNFARVEVLVGTTLQDAEWVGLTGFMDIGICEQFEEMMIKIERGGNDIYST